MYIVRPSTRPHDASRLYTSSTDPPTCDEQFPVIWIVLLFVGLLKFNISFLPIVMLALVFNLTNSIGYTYAVRFLSFSHTTRSAY